MIDFVVGVAEPDLASLSLSLNFFGSDVVIVVPAQSGYAYQLRRATMLSPADWTNVGTAKAGVNGLLALPDPDGRQPGQRFYSVVRNP